MGDAYPQLAQQRDELLSWTRTEEERFLETIAGGLERMAGLSSVSAGEAFKLYDTYGFPIDLTQIVAAERGIAVDVAGFETLLDAQRERSRKARGARSGERGAVGPAVRAKRGEGWTRVQPRVRQKWVGYETVRAATDVLAFQRAGDRLGLILHENPFYAESGGQVSDTGVVAGKGWTLPVAEVRKIEGKTAVFGPYQGPFEPTAVDAQVDEARRRDTERNHTATHLVHAALRKVLGTHVRQAGSVVAPDRLRFDFTHHSPVDDATVRVIEEEVNRHVWENRDVTEREMAYPDALALGAMALFGEKYGDVVRVITIPEVSIELCGGTHVRTTGQIGLLRFSAEVGVGAGVRRVEAVTGPGAFRWFDAQQRMLEEAAQRLGSAPEHLVRKVEGLVEERRKLEKRVEELIKGGGAAAGAQVLDAGGVSVAVSRSVSGDRNEIGAMVDAFRSRTKSGVTVIFATGERAGIHVGVTDDLVARGVTAPEVVNRLAAVTGGKGGGRPHFASAGAGDASRLPDAERQAPSIVRELLAAHP
jgi:alanyl-tRNA synthetase